MIKTYRNTQTEDAFNGVFGRRISADIHTRTQLRLERINVTVSINDLRVPPSFHLEALKGDRKGQHSIRINKQWRICFKWDNGNAFDLEIIDYH